MENCFHSCDSLLIGQLPDLKPSRIYTVPVDLFGDLVGWVVIIVDTCTHYFLPLLRSQYFLDVLLLRREDHDQFENQH